MIFYIIHHDQSAVNTPGRQSFDKLIEALVAWNVHSALIVIDNAKYHKSLPIGTPKGSWKKWRMLDYRNKHNIAVNNSDLKTVIWDKLKKYVDDCIKPTVVWLAIHYTYNL